ncbi:MAG: hypothetical protein U0263_30150 [Polyangiaceae bacterium]
MKTLVLFSAALFLNGCSAVFVGSTTAAVGGAAVLGFECPGYVKTSLRDELTGAELCAEPVRARSGDRERRLMTCRPAPLGEGTWELQAVRGGAPMQVTVERPEHCERYVYAVELSLPAPSVATTAAPHAG